MSAPDNARARVDFTPSGKPVQHGTEGAYVNWKCRCGECTLVARSESKRRADKRARLARIAQAAQALRAASATQMCDHYRTEVEGCPRGCFDKTPDLATAWEQGATYACDRFSAGFDSVILSDNPYRPELEGDN